MKKREKHTICNFQKSPLWRRSQCAAALEPLFSTNCDFTTATSAASFHNNKTDNMFSWARVSGPENKNVI